MIDDRLSTSDERIPLVNTERNRCKPMVIALRENINQRRLDRLRGIRLTARLPDRLNVTLWESECVLKVLVKCVRECVRERGRLVSCVDSCQRRKFSPYRSRLRTAVIGYIRPCGYIYRCLREPRPIPEKNPRSDRLLLRLPIIVPPRISTIRLRAQYQQ